MINTKSEKIHNKIKRNLPFYLTAMLLSRVTSKINSDRNDMATCGVVELSKS